MYESQTKKIKRDSEKFKRVIMNVSPSAKKAIDILIKNGYKAYAVGGAVRDAYLNRTTSDTDVTTQATPSKVTELFSNYRVIPTGLKHGTVTVIIDGEQIEITTFRLDGNYSDNRRPDNVRFVSDVTEDLKRRDFTVNAMAYNEYEGLIDPFGGRADADNKIIRAVGDADVRFEEDALRILRALRFSATLGFDIEEKTAAAAIRKANLLKNVSSERILAELTKLITGNYVEDVLIKFKEIFFVIIPELKPCDGFDQKSKYHCYDVYSHIVKSVAYCKNDKTARLACLLHDAGKPECFSVDERGRGHFYGHHEKGADIAEKILKRLKADNKTVGLIKRLILLHDAVIDCSKTSVKKFLQRNGYEFLKLLVMVKEGDALAHAPVYGKPRAEQSLKILEIANEVIKNGECYSLKTLAVDGNDVKSVGYRGEEVKLKLDVLLNGVIEGEYPNEKEFLLKVIK